jgi:hypothetical protein
MATMSIPTYQKAVERGYWRSAQDMLRAIYSGEQVYWTSEDTYFDADTGAACPAGWNGWRCIQLDNPNRPETTYTTDTITAATFRAVAHRGDGRCMSIDQNNVMVFSAAGAAGCAANWTPP